MSHTKMSKSKIFISIASLDDEELFETVDSAFQNASGEFELSVGIGLLYSARSTLSAAKKIKKKYKGVRLLAKKYNPLLLGVGLGRQRAASLYQDEDFFLQIDSHTFLDKNWDRIFVDTFNDAVSLIGDDLVVLTAIPGAYQNEPFKHVVHELRWTRYPGYIPNELFYNKVPKWNDFQIIRDNYNTERLIPAVKANAAFMFGNKRFAQNTGLEPGSIFFDEEILYSINLVGSGFAMVFPNIEEFPIYHLDNVYESYGHERKMMSGYDINETDIANLASSHYESFINSINNNEACKKYEEYAKIDLRLGYSGQQIPYIPTKFRT